MMNGTQNTRILRMIADSIRRYQLNPRIPRAIPLLISKRFINIIHIHQQILTKS